jgi:hypothetical protein
MRPHRSAVRAPARAIGILLALFSLLPSVRLDLIAIALADACCCHDSLRPHDADCPCKVCTHKRHMGSSAPVITSCAGVFDQGLAVSSFDPVFPVAAIAESAPPLRSPAHALTREPPRDPTSEVPTPPPLRRS